MRPGDIHPRACMEQRLQGYFHNRNPSGSSPPFDSQARSITFGSSNVERAGQFIHSHRDCRTDTDTLSATDAYLTPYPIDLNGVKLYSDLPHWSYILNGHGA